MPTDRTAPRVVTDTQPGLKYALACGVQADGTVTTLNVDASGNLQVDAVDSWKVLAASAVAVPHTGNTSETALATIAVPAGAMGANGIVRVTATWSYTNSVNAKTPRIRVGGLAGTAYAETALTTTQTYTTQRVVQNRNAAASQTAGHAASNPFAAQAAAPVTSTINTASAWDLVLSGQLASAGETITLESYMVEICYRA